MSDDGQAAIDRQLADDWEAEVERITAKLAAEVAHGAEEIANEER